jgi:hypothetical protein
LVKPLIALRHNLIRIINATAANAWHPGPHATTALSPCMHALSIKGNILIVLILNGKVNMPWLPSHCELFSLIKMTSSLKINLHIWIIKRSLYF